MKKTGTLIILAAFWGIIFIILYLVLEQIGAAPVKYIPSVYLVFLSFSIFYKKYWSFNTFTNKRKALKFLLFFFLSVLLSMYVNNLIYRSYKLYEYLVAEKKNGWEGIVYQPDDTLGFKPVPNTRTYRTFPVGDKIPVIFNKNGFRIPLSDTVKDDPPNKTDLLFLGCSFTFGDGCNAEETFPYLVANNIQLSYINAGVCSYGLSHILILADKLIPRYKPKYVVVQYSEWLAARSASLYAPAYYMHLPNPYFSKKNNTFILQYPGFKSQSFNLDSREIKSVYKGSFINFFFQKGLLFYLKEDWLYQKNKISIATNNQLKPSIKIDEIENYAYNKISQIAAANGTTVIILNLGNFEYTKKSHQFFSNKNIKYAEADSVLNNYLAMSLSRDYAKEFNIWKFNGKDSILVDKHPNSKAHRLIANSIINAIRK
jgi:hypothetical protein